MEYKEYLGIDEQKPAFPGVHLIAPTAFDKAVEGLKTILNNWYGRFDLATNLQLYGISGQQYKLWGFLKHLILEARTAKKPINTANKHFYIKTLQSKYDYSNFQILNFMDAFIAADKAGYIPAEISSPWTYQPTTILQDVGEAAGSGLKKNLFPIAVLTIGAIAAYGFATQGVPRLLTPGTR